MKIVLGTAQLNRVYGIKNPKKSLNEKDFKKIIELAKQHNNLYIDTAISYRGVDSILGKCNINRFKIITKIPKIPNNCRNIENWITNSIKLSLKKLKIKSFYAVLIHYSEDLIGEQSRDIFESLKKLKRYGLTKKIGVSIYSINVLQKILEKFKLDIVQGPLNIFDRKITLNSRLNNLRRNNTEYHARSVFLQGLLLKNFLTDKYMIKKYSNIWNKYENWIKKTKITKLEACLGYIYSIRDLKFFIVGVKSYNEYKQIISFKPRSKRIYPLLFNDKRYEDYLVRPDKWLKKV